MVYGVEPRLPGDIFCPAITASPEQDLPNVPTEGRKIELLRLREARANAEQRLRNNTQRDKAIWDSLLQHQVFSVNDHVLMRHEQKLSLEYNWKGPYVIIDCNLDSDTYKLKDLNGNIYNSWVHTDRL